MLLLVRILNIAISRIMLTICINLLVLQLFYQHENGLKWSACVCPCKIKMVYMQKKEGTEEAIYRNLSSSFSFIK